MKGRALSLVGLLLIGLISIVSARNSQPNTTWREDYPRYEANLPGYKLIDGIWHADIAIRKGQYRVELGRVVIRPRPGKEFGEVFRTLSADTSFGDLRLRIDPDPGGHGGEYHSLLFLATSNPVDVMNRLKRTGLFAIVYLPCFDEPALSPNDTYYGNQWWITKISAPAAWDITTGSTSVLLGVIDDGVDETHASNSTYGDLYNNYDNTKGYDFIDIPNHDYDPWATGTDNDHGTPCIGTAGAMTNNSRGVAGLAGGNGTGTPGVKVTMYRTPLTVSGSINAFRKGGQQGVDVFSFSRSGQHHPLRYRVTDSLVTAGHIIVCSAGNDNNSVDYPAKYPKLIAVGATNESDERCDPSDWGSGQGSDYGDSLDIMAPGNNMYTIDRDGSEGYNGLVDQRYTNDWGGTSAAAPQVAAAAALVWSVNSGLTNIRSCPVNVE